MQAWFRSIRQFPPLVWLPWLGNVFLVVVGLVTWLTPYSLRGPLWTVTLISLIVALLAYVLRRRWKQASVRMLLNVSIFISLLALTIALYQTVIRHLPTGPFGMIDLLAREEEASIFSPDRQRSFSLGCRSGVWDGPYRYRLYTNRVFIFHKQVSEFTSRRSCFELSQFSFEWIDTQRVVWNDSSRTPVSGSFQVD